MVRTASKTNKPTKKPATKSGVSAAPLDRGFEQCHWFFNDEVETDAVSKIIKGWVRETYSPDDANAILANPEWHFSIYNGRAAAIYWMSKGLEIDDPRYAHYPEWLRNEYDALIEPGRRILKSRTSKPESHARKLSPLELLAQKVNDTVLTDLDEMEEEWIFGEESKRDIYQLFKVHDVRGQGAVSIVEEWIAPRLSEIISARDNECEQYAEAYSHLNKKEINRRISVFEQMLMDLDKIRSAARATRKPRKRKSKSADKQIKDLKYLKEDNTHKVVSISPTQVPGSIRLYTFNAKTRVLTEYVTLVKSGFEIKGTTIQNHDAESSRSTKLRKPNEFLATVLSKTPRQIDKEWGKLTTKTSSGVSGRINEDTVLLRVLDK